MLSTTINAITLAAGKFLAGTTPPPAPPGGETTNAAKDAAQTSITNSALWTNVIVPISIGLAVIVLLVGVYKVITQIASGKSQGAVKTILLTLLIGGLLFRVDLLFNLIDAAAGVVSSAISAITDLIGGGSDTTTP